jgi:hypothetical protein
MTAANIADEGWFFSRFRCTLLILVFFHGIKVIQLAERKYALVIGGPLFIRLPAVSPSLSTC